MIGKTCVVVGTGDQHLNGKRATIKGYADIDTLDWGPDADGSCIWVTMLEGEWRGADMRLSPRQIVPPGWE